MADLTVTVKSSGGDYTSLNAALAGESKNLVASTQILTIECYAMNDTTPASTGTGYTTSSSYYINIVVPVAERHAGKWDDTKYRLTGLPSGYALLEFKEQYSRVTGIQIGLSGTTGSKAAIDITDGSGNEILDRCIIRNTNTGSNLVGIFLPGISTGVLRNSLIYGFSTTGSTGAIAQYRTQSRMENVTIANCTIGFLQAQTHVNTNVLITNCTTCFSYVSGTRTWTYCASSDATADDGGGAGNRVSQTFTFVDEANADYHLSASDTGARGFGTDLSGSFTVDIDGETRTGTWDIGADQYVAAVAAGSLVFKTQAIAHLMGR